MSGGRGCGECLSSSPYFLLSGASSSGHCRRIFVEEKHIFSTESYQRPRFPQTREPSQPPPSTFDFFIGQETCNEAEQRRPPPRGRVVEKIFNSEKLYLIRKIPIADRLFSILLKRRGISTFKNLSFLKNT